MSFNLSNRTAFPLAITLCHSSNNAIRHRHSLEPGQDWSAEIILPSPSIFSIFQPSVTTVTVQFDHCGTPDASDTAHHHRRSVTSSNALVGWCIVLVNVSAIALTACCKVGHSRHITQYAKLAILLAFLLDIVFCAHTYRGQLPRQAPLLGHEDPSHTARPPLFTVQIPTKTLRRATSQSFTASSQSSPANSQFSSAPSLSRLDSQWALVWLNSQVMLWDTTSDQAITSSLSHR
ncbi:hypothetical protein BDV98DRAFT_599501 [Pterulicium gracile]|uniref:Uncharacterized protein n=1 Tax=Pterulicium gracile TaxID=1884261 RepID=A0A5C3QYS8_9AGAR|nr:hypothetical protein BDV98DRAFT_599501 [Pterula gracilis]